MIYDVLFDIQQRLSVPKNKWNDFGKYYSRSCEDILQGVKPLLAEHKAVLLLPTEIVTINERNYVKATAKLICGDESVEVSASAKECKEAKPKMDDSQTTGSATSYAKKYALNALFAIDDEKDPDQLPPNKEDKPKTKTQKKQSPPQTAPPAQPTAPPPTCKICGKVIEGFTNNKGKVYTAEQAAKRLNNHCLDCYQAEMNRA